MVVEGARAAAKPFGLGLCLSGGGYRAMLFHAGALARLNEAALLSKVEVVGSVSGGSLAAGVLAMAWQKLSFDAAGVSHRLTEEFLEPVLAISQVAIDAPALVRGVLNPFSSAASELARAYARHAFPAEATLKRLPTRPRFIFCASNLSNGSLFRMSRDYVADYRIGVARDADLRLADVVAASSAFPPLLSPLRLDLRAFSWEDEKIDDTIGARVAPGRAVLTDGGVYDNHGIEPVVKRCREVFVSDGGAPWKPSTRAYRDWFSQLKRVLDTTDNQVRSLRRRDLIARFDAARIAAANGVDVGADPDFSRGCYWSIAPSARLLSGAPALAEILGSCVTRPMDVPTGLRFLGEDQTRDVLNWGYLVADQALRAHFDPDLPPPRRLAGLLMTDHRWRRS